MAATLSLGLLFAWSYFFPVKKAEIPAANANANVAAQPSAPLPAPVATYAVPADAGNSPSKFVTIKTPLYQVKFDTRGAVPTSWILLRNKTSENDIPLYSVAGLFKDEIPLELISPEGLKQTPRQTPFRVISGDASIDAVVNEKNYTANVDGDIELKDGESKQVEFTLKDDSGLEVTKTFVFKADSYVSDLQLKVTKGGQNVPNTKLLIGPSIGDQGIKRHTYYQVEPEGVAFVSGSLDRQHAVTIQDKNSGALQINGDADWAGIGDTYFAMAAIPAQKFNGLEYRTSKYDVDISQVREGRSLFQWVTGGTTPTETRYLTTAYVPVPADGSATKLYVGSKDHYLLVQNSEQLTQTVSRPIDIEGFINYGWTGFVTRPIIRPIMWCIGKLNLLTNNYGIAIIVFTLLFYSLLFPLRWSQSRSFKEAAKHQPKMKELQEKTEALKKQGVSIEDPRMRALQMEQLKLTKNAIPLGGCLPLLLQMPLLIALYTAITIALDFRQATFMWLPDLSAGDPFHILEFLFAASMWVTMKFVPTAPSITPEQQMQQKMMSYMMPGMMLLMMWGSASGLLVYWFTGNIVSFIQQMIINRLTKTPPIDPSGIIETTAKATA